MQRQGNAPPLVRKGPCCCCSCSWWSSSPSWAAFLPWQPLCGKHRVTTSSANTVRSPSIDLCLFMGQMWWESPCYCQSGDIRTNSLPCLAGKSNWWLCSLTWDTHACPSLQWCGGTLCWGEPLSPEGVEVPKVVDLSAWCHREVPCSLAAFLNSLLSFPRCVSDRQRSFALGIQWIVVRTLGMEQSEFAHQGGLLALWTMCQAVI